MKVIKYVIFLWLTGLSLSAGSTEFSIFGTYVGVLNHEALGKDQLVRLELIPEREEEGGLKLQGILTLQFGGFDSTEYISYHYHDVAYNFMTGHLTLNEPKQEVDIREVTIRNNVLEGSIFSSMGKVGRVRLAKGGDILPARPLIEPLNGEYRGQCGDDPASLQLYTYRSTSDSSRLGNPYGAYEVKGQLGMIDRFLCAGETKRYCTFAKLQTASYDFFSGDLVLIGEKQNYSCNVSGSKITCNNCQFKRVSGEMKKPETKYPKANKDLRKEFNLKTNTAEGDHSMAGVYNGYLFHEHLNAYQRVRIEMATYQQPTGSGVTLMISAIAKLYFGNSDSEVLVYKFTPVPFPNPLKKLYFLLSRPEADVDAVLQVTELKGGVMSGQWNSIIFGKVGSFVATKNGDLPDIQGAHIINGITSEYVENGKVNQRDLVLNLIVNRARAPLNSDNPFFPLSINGWIWRKSGVLTKKAIITSSYDFYTGRIALVYGVDEVIGGVIKSDSTAKLRRLGGGFGTFMQSFELVPFKKQN